MVKNTYKSYDVYTMNFLKVCLTIHNISVLYHYVLLLKRLQKRHKRQEISSEQIFFVFQALQVPWNLSNFLILQLESLISQNIRNFFRVFCFYFSSSESSPLKFFFWGLESSGFPITGKTFLRKYKSSIFLKYKKNFFGENIRNFFSVDFCYHFYFFWTWASKCTR